MQQLQYPLMELELPWLLAPKLPSHKQVNLTQRLTKCQFDLIDLM